MTAREKAEFAGYEDIMLFANYSYDDAFIGVSEDGRAVYDFDKMVDGVTTGAVTGGMKLRFLTVARVMFRAPALPVLWRALARSSQRFRHLSHRRHTEHRAE